MASPWEEDDFGAGGSGDRNWASGGGSGEDAGDNKCRNCGASDHFARNCPNNDKENYEPLSRACYNCGQTGHNKADCPEPRKAMGACFNCGEEGHSKADCPKPRVFKGTCRICNQEGHPAAQCPERPPDFCRNCKTEGHMAKDCKANRKFDLNHVADFTPVEAWAKMKTASDERDIQEFREALAQYSKSVPSATYADIEKKMREEDFKIFLIALEREEVDVISLIDLQGQLNREYVVGFFLAEKPMRKHLKSRWPSDADENVERLANAGLPYDREIIKCRNCGELGHSARGCKQDRVEHERVEIKCLNCDEVGHRVRDCKKPRKSKGGCRNCGSEEHIAKECPEPRSAADVECRKCNETGHFAKDCPKVEARPPRTCRNCGSEDHMVKDCDQPRKEICRNCDQEGHMARDCPEPKNWAKVKCNRCGEMGHGERRCPQPEEAANGNSLDRNDEPTDGDAWSGATSKSRQQMMSQGDAQNWDSAAKMPEDHNEEWNTAAAPEDDEWVHPRKDKGGW